MFSLKIIYFLSAIFLFNNEIGADETIVQLPQGKIRGHILKSEQGNSYYAFQEIPYAAKPIGSNRFQLPVPPPKWDDVLDTVKNTKICYQNRTKYANLEVSEDCLYINVYTPISPGTKDTLIPVLVWIHGGGYVAESSTYEYYGPQYVMDHGVVVVTFNYRLGIFGFTTTEDSVMPANLGMKDQRMALEWVHDNINLFNGDPEQVTIVGESAGSMAVCLHLLGEWNKNEKVLFHAAIMQSGSALFFNYTGGAKEKAFELGTALDPNFSSHSSEDLLKLLQSQTSEEIYKVGTQVGATSFPIVEKIGDFSYRPLETMVKGNFKRIPVLFGFNSEEWIFMAFSDSAAKTGAGYDKDPGTLISSTFDIPQENKTKAGKLIHHIYTNTSFEKDLGALVRVTSDNSMSTPSLSQVEIQAKHAHIYFYQFSYKGQLGGAMNIPYVPGAERVGHAEDLHYMWDDGSNTDLSKFPKDDQLMLHRYVKLWTNFVKHRNPTPEKDPLLQNLIWPKVDPDDLGKIKYLNMNHTLEVRVNPRYFQKVKKVYYEYVLPHYVHV